MTLKKQNFKISPEYREFLSTCIDIIERNIGDESFNIKKFSQEIGMSHSGLYRKVKSISGQSIAGFIRFIRLRKSAELMVESNYTIKEIAWEVGINDIKYFRKQFSALFGMNPSDYIKNYRNTPNK
ncbi:helix-turn-helix domain-containing protein [Pedobacter terrae]|uniref:helix-turn-helix domain-containing protein n=1 Tax=Pedobacter terrae TaxID=405671 RepID=UPI002FF79A5B